MLTMRWWYFFSYFITVGKIYYIIHWNCFQLRSNKEFFRIFKTFSILIYGIRLLTLPWSSFRFFLLLPPSLSLSLLHHQSEEKKKGQRTHLFSFHPNAVSSFFFFFLFLSFFLSTHHDLFLHFAFLYNPSNWYYIFCSLAIFIGFFGAHMREEEVALFFCDL